MNFTLISTLLLTLAANAFEFSDATKDDFFVRGGNEKALEHLQCIMEMTEHRTFRIKTSTKLQYRCAEVEAGGEQISVNNHKWAALVDYTQPSDHRRFYLFNLDGSRKHRVVSFYVGHGRNGKTNRRNQQSKPGRNTVKNIKYFSNVPGSNTSSSGFFITGHSYVGPINGPSNKELSLAIHGLEKGINDNVCDRAVVMHGTGAVNESGSKKGVRRMSSGCFIVDWDWVSELATRMRGAEESMKSKKGGIPFFVYGPREAALAKDYYCGKKAQKTVMFY